MTSDLAGRTRAPAGLRWTAVAVAAVFGCTTVRAPASAMGETVPLKDGRAEPQLELWLESGRAISPAESARAAAEARAALRAALASRQEPDGDALLVVRAQGVARTGSRRSDQRAAVAGIVVGAAVIVAAVVVLVVASKGKGGGGRGGAPGAGRGASAGRGAAATRAAGATASGAVRGAPGAVRAAGVRPGLPRPSPGLRPPGPVARPVPVATARPAPAPAPRLGPVPPGRADGFVWIDLWVGFDVGPVYPEPAGVPVWGPVPTDGPWAPPWDDDASPADEPADGAEEPAALVLAPLPELGVWERGFFAKDETALELTWVDRRSGAPLRVKRVRAGIDPRDAGKVRALLDAALADERGWRPADDAG